MLAPGAVHVPGFLDGPSQRRLASAAQGWADRAGGFRTPRLPNGSSMSVGMVCLGWWWTPYRYDRTDGDGRPAAPLPRWLVELGGRALAAARAVDPLVGGPAFEPDVALVNRYGPGARMGLHVDRDERADDPVVSLSVGDACTFRFGNPDRRGRPWTDVRLASGDLVVFGGPARRAYHGVPRVEAGSAPSGLPTTGRLNVTLRRTGLTAPRAPARS